MTSQLLEHGANGLSLTPTASSRSQISLANTRSIRSHAGGTSKFRTIITEPREWLRSGHWTQCTDKTSVCIAWARDEPPSPTEHEPEHTASTSPTLQVRPSTSATSDAESVSTAAAAKPSYEQRGGTSWWTFNRKAGQSSGEEQEQPDSLPHPQHVRKAQLADPECCQCRKVDTPHLENDLGHG